MSACEQSNKRAQRRDQHSFCIFTDLLGEQTSAWTHLRALRHEDSHPERQVICVRRPRRVPRRLRLRKLAHSRVRAIIPRLPTHAIRKPPARAPNREVEDQIERLVKRCGGAPPVAVPYILYDDLARAVLRRLRVAAALPEALPALALDLDREHRIEPRIHVYPYEVLRPLERVCVEGVRVRLLLQAPPTKDSRVQRRERPVVQRTAHIVHALGGVRCGVAAGLHHLAKGSVSSIYQHTVGRLTSISPDNGQAP